MKSNRQETKHQLVKSIQERAITYEIQQVKSLLNLLFEDAKANLVNCSPDTFQRAQGEAQAYDNLIRIMNRAEIKPAMAKE